MSTRRFAAYFLAVSAGSTVAFASTLMGQPAPQEPSMREAGMVLTAADAGLGLLPEMTRLLQASRRHPGNHPPSNTAQIALVK